MVAKLWFGGPGLDAAVANVIKPIGTVFLQLIFMVVVPLIFSAIVLGVVELGDVGRLGRVGLRCLGMTVLLSGLSVVVGLAVVNIFKPGQTIAPEVRDKLVAQYTTAGRHQDRAGQPKRSRSRKRCSNSSPPIRSKKPSTPSIPKKPKAG